MKSFHVESYSCSHVTVLLSKASEAAGQAAATLAGPLVYVLWLYVCVCLRLLLQGLYGWQERELVVN